jgi:hypothetical protein
MMLETCERSENYIQNFCQQMTKEDYRPSRRKKKKKKFNMCLGETGCEVWGRT